MSLVPNAIFESRIEFIMKKSIYSLIPFAFLFAVLSVTSSELHKTILDFEKGRVDTLPQDWRVEGGDWSVDPLIVPQPNPNVHRAVKSSMHVAFPGICTTEEGDVLIVYREGLHHASGKAEDGRIMMVRSSDNGCTWQEPVLVYDDPNYDDRNATISRMNDGTLCVIWDKYLNRKHHWAWLITSSDHGRTWSEARKITTLENVHTRSPGIDLGNGKWLFPWSDADHGPRTATYFTIYDPQTGEFQEIRATERGKRNYADEVCVTMAKSGKLVALIRSPSDPALWQIESFDLGKTWSEPKLTEIPSQFTPADIMTLPNGWLVASFSFRERRNERLCVSRDEGETWDVENSLDVFDATYGYGDRSYPASTLIDANTIGTTLYETSSAPTGGTIYFVTTSTAAFSQPKVNTLHQRNPSAEQAFLYWPEEKDVHAVSVDYRFTGLFGNPPNRIGFVLSDEDQSDFAVQYQMGTSPTRREWPYNAVRWIEIQNDTETVLTEQTIESDYYDDGAVHCLQLKKENKDWIFSIDNEPQLILDVDSLKPEGIVVQRANIAIYRIELHSNE